MNILNLTQGSMAVSNDQCVCLCRDKHNVMLIYQLADLAIAIE